MVIEFLSGLFGFGELKLRLLLVFDVDFGEALAGFGERAKNLNILPAGRRCDKRDAWQLAAEVGGVAVAVLGVVQDGVDIVEDVPLCDGAVAVAGAKLFESSWSAIIRGHSNAINSGSG